MISGDLYNKDTVFVHATSIITPHIFKKLGYRIIGQLVVFTV